MEFFSAACGGFSFYIPMRIVVPFSSSYFPALNVAGPIARGIFRIVMRHMSATVA